MNIDIVVIGLQCENTLKACLQSVLSSADKFISNVIYVDGGSTDKSIHIAQSFHNLHIIELKNKHPSPGAQRNAGWRYGTSEYIFFIDGDTILSKNFIKEALKILEAQHNDYIGAVFGQRKELFTDDSILNFIGNIEWNPPFQNNSKEYAIVHYNTLDSASLDSKAKDTIAPPQRMVQSRFVSSFGGDVLVRRSALEITGGYNTTLIAGEDPELGLRFGLFGYAIWYEHIDMTYHDLGYALPKNNKNIIIYIKTLAKIAKRSYRTGYGYAAVGLQYITQKSIFPNSCLSIKDTAQGRIIKESEYNNAVTPSFINKKCQESKNFWKRELLRIAIRGCGSMACILSSLLLLIFIFYTLFSQNHTINATDEVVYGVWSVTALLLYITIFAINTVLGIILLCYPRFFSVKKMMVLRQLSRKEARAYAWYCSLVVIPQSVGLIRFLWGKITGNPLQNKKPQPESIVKNIYNVIIIIAVLFTTLSCTPRVSPYIPDEEETITYVNTLENKDILQQETDNSLDFRTKAKKHEIFSNEDAVRAMSEVLPDEYLLGAGDVLSLEVWNRPKLSDPHIVVAPDGKITVMRIGIVEVAGRSIDDVINEIETRLKFFYHDPEVRLSILTYKNNKAFVLGRVTSPGLIEFSGRGTLLEALSRAGGLPILSEKSFLTKCAIIRGKKQILWIDLRDLLQNGNMALNARIYNNDIIFIPESENELVYVMGEVMVPGAIQLKAEISYLDALMLSGGPTKAADLEHTFVIRFDNAQRRIRRVNLKQMLEEGDGSQNFVLKSNDVIYVSETGMASFNYKMQQLLPALEVLNLGTSVLERFGIMENLRGKWYGTEGFVDGD